MSRGASASISITFASQSSTHTGLHNEVMELGTLLASIEHDLANIANASADVVLVLIAFNVKVLSRACIRLRAVENKASDKFLSRNEDDRAKIRYHIGSAVQSMLNAKASCVLDVVTSSTSFATEPLVKDRSSEAAIAPLVEALRSRCITQAILPPSETGFNAFLTGDSLEQADATFKLLADLIAQLSRTIESDDVENDKLVTQQVSVFVDPYPELRRIMLDLGLLCDETRGEVFPGVKADNLIPVLDTFGSACAW